MGNQTMMPIHQELFPGIVLVFVVMEYKARVLIIELLLGSVGSEHGVGLGMRLGEFLDVHMLNRKLIEGLLVDVHIRLVGIMTTSPILWLVSIHGNLKDGSRVTFSLVTISEIGA